MRSQDSSGQSGVLVLLGVLFTIILARLDNTIVSTVMPVALPELSGAHLYTWPFAAYMLAAAVSMPIWESGSDRWGRRRTHLVRIVVFTNGSGLCASALVPSRSGLEARHPSRRRTYLVAFKVGSGLCAVARTMMESSAVVPSKAAQREPERLFRLFCWGVVDPRGPALGARFPSAPFPAEVARVFDGRVRRGAK